VTGNAVTHSAEGVAQFTNLGVSRSGNGFRLSFEFVPYGVGDAVIGVSQLFSITPGRPYSLIILTEIDAHWRGVPPGQQPILGLLDGYGNRITDVSGVVSVVIIKEQELIGDLKGMPTAHYRKGGDAVFTDLAVTPKVQDYENFKLVFTSKGLVATSAPFAIVSGPLYYIAVEKPLVGSVANLEGGRLYPQITVVALDVGGGVVYGYDASGCNGLECRISVRIMQVVPHGATVPSCCDFCYTQCTNAPMTGTTDLLAAKGKVVFTDLQIATVGLYNLVFQTSTFGGRLPVKIKTVGIQVASAEVLKVETQPGFVATGSVFRQQPVIRIENAAGDTILAAMHSVTVGIASSASCTGLRSATQNRSSANSSMIAYVVAVRGIATFTDLSIDSAPSSLCTLTFTMSIANNGSAPFISVNSNPFSIVESGASLFLLTHPSGAEAGVAVRIQPALILKDKGGNILYTDDTAKAVGMDAQGREVRLIGRVEVPTYRGVANFTDLAVEKIQTAFSVLFQVGNFWVKSLDFDVVAGNVSSLSILVQPSESSTERKLTPTVLLRAADTGGNVPLVLSTVTAELIPSTILGCCSGCIGSIDAEGKVKFPDLKITCRGRSMRLMFSAGTFSIVSASFDIHGDPVAIEMHNFPSVRSKMAGAVLIDSPAVMLLDASNMRATTVDKNVSMALSFLKIDGSHQAMPALSMRGTTQVESLYGVATFSDLSVIKAAKDLVFVFSIGAFELVSEPFEITHGPPMMIALAQQPDSLQFTGMSVVPFPILVLYDTFGNRATSSPNLISACIDGAGGCDSVGDVAIQSLDVTPLVATAVFENIKLLWRRKDASSGTSVSIRFYMRDQASVTAVSHSFQVFYNALSLKITTQPALSRVGEAMRVSPIVEIQDAGGYKFAQIPGGFSYLELNVSMAQKSSSAYARLSRNGQTCPCLVRFYKGVATVTGLAIDIPGTFYSLDFSLPAMGIMNVFSSQFSVSGLASLAYLHLQPPIGIVYQQPFELLLRIRDANHVPVITDTVKAEVYVSDPSTCLMKRPPIMSGTLSLASPSGDAHFTDLVIDRAYPCKLRICFKLDAAATVIPHLRLGSVCTIDFTVRHGVGHQLSLQQIPTLTSSDLLSPRPQVSVTDKAANVVLDFNGTIKAVLHDSNNSAVANYSFQSPVVSGVAHFEITVQTPGTGYRLQFEALQNGGSGNLKIWSNRFEVKPGPVTNLVVMTQPGNGVAGLKLSRSAVVAAVDKGGHVATSFAGLVVAFKASGETGANSALAGNLLAVAKNGLATFDGIVVNESDSGLVIRFETSSSCRMQVSSSQIIITDNTTSFVQVVQASGGRGGATFTTQPRFQALDKRSEKAILTSGFVCLRLAPWASASGSLSGTRFASFQDGIARFTDLTINKVGTYWLIYDLLITGDANANQACAHGPFIGSINQTGLQVGTGPVARMKLDHEYQQTVTGGVPFLVSPVIKLYDAGDNLMSDDTVTDIKVTLDYLGYKSNPPSLNMSGESLHTRVFFLR
jgi:hypothetical protein